MGSSIKDEDKYKLEITWLDKNVKYSDSLQLSLKTNIIQAVEAATGLATHKIQVFEKKN